MTTHTVHLNGTRIAIPPGQTLAELLAQLAEPADQVATALNGEFIAKAQRSGTRLAAGDHITVFKAIVGG